MMSTKNNIAICKVCGGNYGVPLGLQWACWNDVYGKEYTIIFKHPLEVKQVYRLSKILRTGVKPVYDRWKQDPTAFNGLSMQQAYTARKVFGASGLEMEIQPELNEYASFEKCWDTERDCLSLLIEIAKDIIQRILSGRHLPEDWFALEAETNALFSSLSGQYADAVRDMFYESGAGDMLGMMCSWLRYGTDNNIR